jgi:hypothetical protein
MALTPAQATTLKAHLTHPDQSAALGAFLAAADYPALATWLNTLASPQVLLWRPSIPVPELNAVIVWADFAALTVQKQNTYLAMTQGGIIDATFPSIRAGFAAVFTAGSASTLALAAAAQVPGTRWQALLAVSGVTPVFGQLLTPEDVQFALLQG